MKLGLLLLAGILVAPGTMAFETCAKMMNGNTCEAIDKRTRVYEMCCSRAEKTAPAKPYRKKTQAELVMEQIQANVIAHKMYCEHHRGVAECKTSAHSKYDNQATTGHNKRGHLKPESQPHHDLDAR